MVNWTRRRTSYSSSAVGKLVGEAGTARSLLWSKADPLGVTGGGIGFVNYGPSTAAWTPPHSWLGMESDGLDTTQPAKARVMF